MAITDSEDNDVIAIIGRSLHASKRAGVGWPEAWIEAIGQIPPAAGEDERAALIALSTTSAAWRRAYLNEAPTRGEILVAQLLAQIEDEPAASARELGAITVLR